jgi:ubiquinone/menaquinone biosynthesis C-methylase UbiE
MTATKDDVKAFWNAEACGEVLLEGSAEERFETQARARYKLEPYIAAFARFEEGRGKDVLEIGVGLGADHREWARHTPRRLCGVDLTERAIEMTKQRFASMGLQSELCTADAEQLPFEDSSFDVVYSYGVLHHTPDTQSAVNEVWRVLRPGGKARIMIYHSPSIVGGLLWARYGLLRARPFMSLADVYSDYLESPGTKAYSVEDARKLFRRFKHLNIHVQLSHGDLLDGPVGQRHPSLALVAAKALWPRKLIKRIGSGYGTGLMIEASK